MFTKESVQKEHFLKKNRPQSEKWAQKEPVQMCQKEHFGKGEKKK